MDIINKDFEKFYLEKNITSDEILSSIESKLNSLVDKYRKK